MAIQLERMGWTNENPPALNDTSLVLFEDKIEQGLNDSNDNVEDFTSMVIFNEKITENNHFYKKGNLVFISYQGEGKTHIQNEILFTIPADYRPKSAQTYGTFIVNDEAYGVVLIRSTGECSISFISSTTVSGRVYFSMFYCIEPTEQAEQIE